MYLTVAQNNEKYLWTKQMKKRVSGPKEWLVGCSKREELEIGIGED